MSKVIALDDKLKLTAEQKVLALRKKKMRAVYKVFQCTQCASKCERCGVSMEFEQGQQTKSPKIPYHFCEGCAEEYLDYIHRLQGQGDSEAYWRNHHWLKVWQNWIEYQGAVDQFLRSKEFRNLMEELGPMEHPCK